MTWSRARPVSNVGGAAIEIVAVGPGGSRDLLVWIPSNFADMRPTYVLRRPVSLSPGSVIALRSTDAAVRATIGVIARR